MDKNEIYYFDVQVLGTGQESPQVKMSGNPLHRENRENGKKRSPCQGKHREFGNFAKTQGILFAQVVSKSKRYFNICHANVPKFFEAG